MIEILFDDIILGLLSFITSLVAGIIGFGGGMLLIAALPFFLPVNAIIPVHGVVQLSSNLSRAYFGYKDIQYKVLPAFILGSLVGTLLFAAILSLLPIEYIPLFIGTYLLLSLWSEKFNKKISRFENFYIMGFLQTGLAVIVGVSGPIALTLLHKRYENKNQVIATAALLMSITHLFKISVFIYFGFLFWDYLNSMILMIIGAIIGSYAGTYLRQKIYGKKMLIFVKILISLLAIKLIISVI